ncbi:MAG TPA: FHA domain-containing protein [Ornithinimicrobium sp.]|nr:FHA domain-containing protein [Ornithinimicrobium sp.]
MTDVSAPTTASAGPGAPSLRVEADLTLTVDTGRADDDPGRRLTGRITGSGSTLTVHLQGLDELPMGADLRTTVDPVRDVARLLAEDGLTVVLEGDQGRILSLGRVRASILDRAVTGSRHIALHDRRAALRLARSKGDEGAPSLRGLVPPSTPWPLAPTLAPPRRRHVTTTHDPLGGGRPRLVYYTAPPEQGGARRELDLRRGTTTVGGGPEDDLVLDGLAPGQLQVRRNPATDEYEVVPVPGAPVRVHGAEVDRPVPLRTGSVVSVGGWSSTYRREEYADHGRPYGGRAGGEFARQRPQPPRPRYER